MNAKPGSYRTAFLIWFFCLRHDLHNTGTARTGTCRRCHQDIDENGDAR